MSRTHTHTHTHTKILLMTNLVQICPRLYTEKELFSARKHSKYTKILSFKSAFEHFKYNYGLTLEVAKKRILEAWLFTRQTSVDEENSKEDWAVVLESWYGFRRIAMRFQGIPNWVCWYHQFPRRRLEGPRGLVFSPDMGGGWS